MKVPSAFTTRVPTFGIVAVTPAVNVPEIPAILNCVTVIALPSGSVSLVKTLPFIGVSSGPVRLSSFAATGLSFTGVIVIVKLAAAIAPSLSVMT